MTAKAMQCPLRRAAGFWILFSLRSFIWQTQTGPFGFWILRSCKVWILQCM